MGNGHSGTVAGMEFKKGKDRPLGCTEEPGNVVNLALRAPNSNSAWVLLVIPPEHAGLAHVNGKDGGADFFVKLDPATHRTGDTWHLELTPPFSPAGVKYAWLLDPPLGDNGEPAAHAKRIVDPHALCLDSPAASAWNRREKKKYSPLATVPDVRAVRDFDWQGVTPPRLHLKDLIIYEAHVRGFTKNRDSGLSDWDALSGTYLGFVEKIPYLKRLGVNCVELLPVFEFDETACPRKNPFNGQQLCNYWGYSTVAFCVPMQRFSARDRIGASIVGFKTLVRELHRQGIEVMLDVVFNHTAEGTWGESNWHSLAAIAKSHYYLLSKGHDTNYTGCGNTVNANNPVCADWIIDCLCYWVEEMHVDGFRFDLASSLCRGGDGQIMHEPPVIRRMCNDPRLSRAKLVAEPWDCSWPSGYLVGRFPSCGPPRFAEWNGMWRDTVRRFIKGDEGMKGDFATRMCGSADLFQHNGRGPFHSINFITAHDGFTLRDLVSYNYKHNDCNNEQSGDDHNNSWNCGHEGHTGDGGVNHLREKQIRNFLVALMLSCGTPMLVFGDEYGRSQDGCNNGWCQDNISWFSWNAMAKEENKLFRFARLLIGLRKDYAHIFCRTSFVGGGDIWWRVHWDDPYNYICYVLHDRQAKGGYGGLLIAFNAGHEMRACNLPPEKEWYRLIDTNLAPPKDFCENEASATKINSGEYVMQPYSCIVLKTSASNADAHDFGKSDREFASSQQLSKDLAAITNRRMSMEFTSLLAAEEKEVLQEITRCPSGFLECLNEGTPIPAPSIPSHEPTEAMAMAMMQRRSSMSGCFLEIAAEKEGAEPTVVVSRPPPKAESGVAGSRLCLGSTLLAELGPGRRLVAELYEEATEAGGVRWVLDATAVGSGWGSGELLLHWGVLHDTVSGWQPPTAAVLAASTPPSKAVVGASRTGFPPPDAAGRRSVSLTFAKEDLPRRAVTFVLHVPPSEWVKHGGGDFLVDVPQKPLSDRAEEVAAALERAKASLLMKLPASSKQKCLAWSVQNFHLAAIFAVSPEGCTVKMVTDSTAPQLVLHYGSGDEKSRWQNGRDAEFKAVPAVESKVVKEASVQVPAAEVTGRFMFVLRLGENNWVKDGARDFAVLLPEA